MIKFRYIFISLLMSFGMVSCQGDWVNYSPIDMWSAPIEYNDSDAPQHLSVAAVAIQPSRWDKNITIERMRVMIERIKDAHPDIQVIVFGELILEWYDDPSGKAYQQSMAESISGPSVVTLIGYAGFYGVNIVFGMTERDNATGHLYNSQILIRPTGEIERYRKRNLNQTDKENGFQAGTEMKIAIIDGVRAAMFICSDMQSESITKEINEAKVDVILHSLTSTTHLNSDISFMAGQFNAWIVFSNRFGNEETFDYTGFIHIINPVGTIVKNGTGPDQFIYRRLGIFPKDQ